jgi:predicted metal-binding membrane protein
MPSQTSSANSRAVALNRRERGVILLALLSAAAIAWVYLWTIGRDMSGMAKPVAASWTLTAFVLSLAMWWVMMIGMMVPSAAPMVLTFATLNRRKRAQGQGFVPTAVFALGYLIVWGIFSITATTAQWALDRLALLSPTLGVTSPVLGGLLLILARISHTGK